MAKKIPAVQTGLLDTAADNDGASTAQRIGGIDADGLEDIVPVPANKGVVDPLAPIRPTQRLVPVGITNEILEHAKTTFGVAKEDDPAFWDVVKASFRRSNTVGSLLSSEGIAESFRTDTSPELDPQAIAARLKADNLLVEANAFKGVITEQDYEAVKADVRREREDRRLIDASGWTGFATEVVAGIADPVNLLPIGAGLKGAATVGSAALRIGTSAAASAAVTEAALQTTQQTRTAEESAVGVGGAFVLGSVLGTAAYKIVGRKLASKIEGRLTEDFADVTGPEASNSVLGVGPKGQAAGAQALDAYRQARELADEQGRVNALGFDTVLKNLGTPFAKLGRAGAWIDQGLRNPILDLQDSLAPEARRFIGEFTNSPWITKADTGTKGRTTDTDGANVAGLVLNYRGSLAQFLSESEALWRANSGKYGDGSRFGSSASKEDFAQRVYFAAINGGVSSDGDKAVEAAAQSLQNRVFRPIGQKLIEVGLLPVTSGLKAISSGGYVPRVWKRGVVVEKREKFLELVGNWASQNIEADVVRLVAAGDTKGLREMAKRLRLAPRDLEDIETRADAIEIAAARTAQKMFDNMTDVTVPLNDYDIRAGGESYLKGRVLDIPDEVLAREGFVETDVFMLARRYTNTAGTDAAIATRFSYAKTTKVRDEAGEVVEETELVPDLNLTHLRTTIKDQYEDLLGSISVDSKRHAELVRERERTLTAVEALRDIVRGRYADGGSKQFERAVHLATTLNYVRMLGGTVLSSLTDVPNLIIANGFARTMRLGFAPMLRDFGAAYKSADSDLRRASRIAGAVTEIEFNGRMAEIAGLSDPFDPDAGKFEKALSRLSNTFSNVTGITYWTSFMKQIAYNTTQARIIENVAKVGYGKLGNAERAWMNSLGIGEAEAAKIRSLWEAQPEADKYRAGIAFANYESWADKKTAERFKAALANESNNVIVSPSAGDMPVFAATPYGQALFQFKSFAFANHARVLGRNIQLANLDREKALSVYGGLAGLVMMAALVDSTKKWMNDAGGEKFNEGSAVERWTKNPGSALYDTLDRSGVFALIFEGSNILGKFGFPTIKGGFEKALGDESRATVRRRAVKDSAAVASDVASVIAGPTGSLAVDLLSTGAAAARQFPALIGDEDVAPPTRAEVRRGRRLLPFQNAPGVQQILNYGEMQVGTAFDWPELPR